MSLCENCLRFECSCGKSKLALLIAKELSEVTE